ncbi:MAG: hypothetical protein RJA63_731 [Pseudomonadota bacterium]|jgi:hypothetical protein
MAGAYQRQWDVRMLELTPVWRQWDVGMLELTPVCRGIAPNGKDCIRCNALRLLTPYALRLTALTPGFDRILAVQCASLIDTLPIAPYGLDTPGS